MRKFGLLAVLLLAAACKGTDNVGPPVTTTVLVTSSPTTITVNGTAQASAIVKDQNGDPLSGKTITWTSLNQAVATVSQAGVIKGISPGTAEIQGSVDGVTGKATIQVVAPVPSCVGGTTEVALNPGEVRVLSASTTKGCINFAATTPASAYLVIGANTNPQVDQVETYIMKSDIGAIAPSNNLLANPLHSAAQLVVPLPELASSLQLSFESKIRATERRELNMDAGRRAYQNRLLSSAGRASINVAAIPSVGEKRNFKVPSSCSNFKTITATARYISNRAILYTDDGSPSGGFVDSDFQEIGTEFDNLIYPTDTEYFGDPMDLDANSRVIILYTPKVNELTPAGNPGGFVGGFFFAGDLFPATGTSGQQVCPQSNVGELFYVLAPDPNGTINGNKRTTADVRQGTRGTIAHEFQHMINASERLKSPVEQEFEDVWLDEALAHFAEDLNGRKLKGLNETGNYSFSTLRSNVNDYNAFFFQNFARFQRYLQNPSKFSPTSNLFAPDSLGTRGAAWALVRYTADHYAPGGDVRAFINSLVHGAAVTNGVTGVNNLVSHAGGIPFDTLIAGWMVANYADDFGIAGLAAKYQYKTYDMRSNVIPLTTTGTYPLVVTEIAGTGFSTNATVRSGTGNYFWFSRPASGPVRSFRMLNTDGVTAASFTGASFVILRTQ